jgi:glycerol-3-phosphate acyltransferase PlsY
MKGLTIQKIISYILIPIGILLALNVINGLIIAISPYTALGCVGVFLLVLFLTRFVSLSSILASMAFPVFILVIFNVENDAYRIFAIAVALLVVLTHQKNIGRLLSGSENKVPIFKNRDRKRIRRG